MTYSTSRTTIVTVPTTLLVFLLSASGTGPTVNGTSRYRCGNGRACGAFTGIARRCTSR